MKTPVEVPFFVIPLTVVLFILLAFGFFGESLRAQMYKDMYYRMQDDAVRAGQAYWKIRNDGKANFTWK
jgi:hypothetical protein